jgi:hypothetical protein
MAFAAGRAEVVRSCSTDKSWEALQSGSRLSRTDHDSAGLPLNVFRFRLGRSWPMLLYGMRGAGCRFRGERVGVARVFDCVGLYAGLIFLAASTRSAVSNGKLSRTFNQFAR